MSTSDAPSIYLTQLMQWSPEQVVQPFSLVLLLSLPALWAFSSPKMWAFSFQGSWGLIGSVERILLQRILEALDSERAEVVSVQLTALKSFVGIWLVERFDSYFWAQFKLMAVYYHYQAYNSIMKILLIAVILVSITQADQYVPISKTPYGLELGARQGNFHLEAFLDLLCPASKASYQTLLNVMKTIDFEARGIKFTFQHIPLPYHFFSFKIHQALMYVQSKGSKEAAKAVINYFYNNQNLYEEQTLFQQPMEEVLDVIASVVASVAKVDQAELRKQLEGSTSSDSMTRFNWKYSIEVHGVSGTPTFVANSVRIDGAQNYGFNEWVEFFRKYTQ